MYVELHCASAFSFLAGASTPEALVDRAAELGYSALALVDRDGLYGAPRFHKAARASGLTPIVGAELTVGERPTGARPGRTARMALPVLVATREGYRNLCRLLTRMHLRAPKGEGVLMLDDFEGQTRGLIALAGRELLLGMRLGVGGLLDRLVGLFGRDQVYVELQRHLRRDEEADLQVLCDLAEAFHVPVLATNGVRFAAAGDRPIYDVLTCIRHGTTLERAGRRLAPNAERYLKPAGEMGRLFGDRPAAVAAARELAGRLEYTMDDLGYRFPEYPVPPGETPVSFLRRIVDIGARERYRPYHQRARDQIAHELQLIEKLDLAGYFLIVWDIVNYCRQHDILAQGRGSAANSAVCYSLGITAVDPVGMELLFERFLSEERGEWPDIDIDLPSGDRRERVIQHIYARYNGGSVGGAGGDGPKAGMTANVITYRGRSAAREAGKVLGLEPVQIDRLAKAMTSFEFVDPDDTLARHLASAGFAPGEPRLQLFGEIWRRLIDLPRHLGQHSGGMVLCHGRLDEIVPLENASMPGRVVVQWDKDDCADMGLIKVDLLGLGMMAVLQDAIHLVNTGSVSDSQGAHVRACEGAARGTGAPASDRAGVRGGAPAVLDLSHLPPDDPEVYRLLQAADTIGVFQVESRAQMATLPRLKPACFYDIVVEVAIIRPGPIVGQMVHPYLNRRAGREPVAYAHPSLEPILKRTLGVPLFQEQLLRMAMAAAGFSGGQAEELRRAFGFKRSERRMRQIEVQLREGMARQGIDEAAAEAIVQSIGAFALYGFPESHAASFALLAYASAYLKVHYPAAFYTALLNNQPMGFYHPATLVKDAQRRGVRFVPVDVQRSDWPCTIEADGRIRLGLMYVRGLRQDVGRAMAGSRPRERESKGRHVMAEPVSCPKCGSDDPSMIEEVGEGAYFCNTCANDWSAPAAAPAPRFRSVDELVARTGARRDELQTLADVGALNAFGYDRRTALWQAERAVRPAGELFREQDPGFGIRDSNEPGMTVDGPSPASRTPSPESRTRASELRGPLPAMSPTDRVVADYAGTGLTIGPHPMALRRGELAMRGVLRAVDLSQAREGRRVRVAGAVITRQRPGTAKGFVFLTLEDETGIANVIVRPDLFDRERMAIVSEPFLLIEGALQNQEGVTSVRADRVQGLPGAAVDPPSHDFY